MLKIVTFKWDAGLHPKKNLKFETWHVEILYSMLKRNLQIPFELICITDQFCDLRDEITVLPLWSWGSGYPGCFRRLKLFSPVMEKFIGERFVLIDLDVIIIDDLTPLFQRDEDFIIWGEKERNNPYCGSLFMLKAGTRTEVWNSFNIDNYPCQRDNGTYRLGTDQNHIYNTIPNEATWTTEDGVYNFGFDIRINPRLRNKRRYKDVANNRNIRGGDGKLPENARIIFFNGKDDPSKPELQEQYPWIREYWK